MNIMTQTFGFLVDHLPVGFGAPLVESSRSPAPSKVVLEDNTLRKTNMTGWKIPSSHRRYIFKWVEFSIVMLVFGGVYIIGYQRFLLLWWETPKSQWHWHLSSKLNFKGVSLGVIESFSPLMLYLGTQTSWNHYPTGSMNGTCTYIRHHNELYMYVYSWIYHCRVLKKTNHPHVNLRFLCTSPPAPRNSNDACQRKRRRNAGVLQSCWLRWGEYDAGLPWTYCWWFRNPAIYQLR